MRHREKGVPIYLGDTLFLYNVCVVGMTLLIHRVEELFVGSGVGHLFLQKLHGFDRSEVVEVVSKHYAAGQNVGGDKKVVATGARGCKVDGRVEATVGKFAVELQFHVAGAFKLFEYHIVHLGACFGEGSGDDGERTAPFYIAGCTEEAFGFLQGVGLDTAA